MPKFYRTLRRQFLKLKKIIPYDEFLSFQKWLISLIKTNYDIRKRSHEISREKQIKGFSPLLDLEKEKAKRGEIFYIDFGVNIGSEYRYHHFGIVIRVEGKLAIVVPLTSKNTSYNKNNPLVVNLGLINNMPIQTDSYALINQIRSVSRARLKRIVKGSGSSKIIYRPKLNNSQLDMIDECIKNYLTSRQNNV